MSKYNKSWDLETIPFDAIPRELLEQWWVRYMNEKRTVKLRAGLSDEEIAKAERDAENNRRSRRGERLSSEERSRIAKAAAAKREQSKTVKEAKNGHR
jgi:hypothetical protein